MSAGDLAQMRLLAPRPAPTCGCAEHEVLAARDEDGDFICCGCGRPLTLSLTALLALHSAAEALEPRAA